MNERIITAVATIENLEDKGVMVVARGGAYGSARLVMKDTITGDEYDYNEVASMANVMRKVGILKNVSADEGKS